MTTISVGPLPGAAADLARRALQALCPPVRATRFWITQAGVLSIAVYHDVLLVDMHQNHRPFGVAEAMSSALLLVPVIYAALNFAVRGAVATAVWATALIAPHWLLMRPLDGGHVIIELGNMAVLNTVAVVVGQRVAGERRARQRAEAALRAARTASARYQGLFDQQPAPVLITDVGGTIHETNIAAARLLGSMAPGTDVARLLPTTIARLLAAEPPRLELATADGDTRLFVPTAHTVQIDGSSSLVQIVLTDVTEQYRRQQEQRAFSSRLLAVQEEERRRLAQELHDDPLQNLVYLTRALQDLSEAPDLPPRLASVMRSDSALTAQTSGALRKLIHGLRPPALDDIGMTPALRQLAADMRARGVPSVALRCSGAEERLPPDLKLTAYRIVQEALNNVLRHADAEHVVVTVRYTDPLVLTISDDGRGLPPARPPHEGSSPGLGLLGMRERAALVGGTVQIEARSPHGTRVRAALPTSAPSAGRADGLGAIDRNR